MQYSMTHSNNNTMSALLCTLPTPFKNDTISPDDVSVGDCSFASMTDEAWVNLDTQMNNHDIDEFTRLLTMDTAIEGDLNIGTNPHHDIDNDDGGATTETEQDEYHSSSASMSSTSTFSEEDNYYYHNMKPSDITMSPLTSVQSFDSHDCSMYVDEDEDDEDDDQFKSLDILALPTISTSELNKRMEESISRLAVCMKRSEMSREKILNKGGIWGCNLRSMHRSVLMNTSTN